MATVADLQALIDKAPNSSVLTIPAGTYLQGPTDTLLLSMRAGLTIVATGVILRRDSSVPDNQIPIGHDRQILIENSSGVELHNLTVKGPKPDSKGYDETMESQHNIAISGGTDNRVAGCVLQRAWGDHVYIAAGAQNTTVCATQMHQCGRHGITVASGTNTLVCASTIDESHRYNVAFSENISTDVIQDAVIAWNTLLNPNIAFINGQDQVKGRAIFDPNVCQRTDA